jgi:hypothetical protein
MTQTITLFRCVPHGTDLSRSSCASRYESMNKKHLRTPPGPRPIGQGCVGCSVGKAHSDGDRVETWADGKPIVFIDKLVQISSAPAKAKPMTSVPMKTAPAKPLEIPDELKVKARAGIVAAHIEPGRVGAMIAEGREMRGGFEKRVTNPMQRKEEARDRMAGHIASAPETEVPVLAQDVPVSPRLAEAEGVEAEEEAAALPRIVGDENERLEDILIEYQGATRSVKDWAAHCGVTMAAVRERRSKGMTLGEACTMPRQRGGRLPREPRAAEAGDLPVLTGDETKRITTRFLVLPFLRQFAIAKRLEVASDKESRLRESDFFKLVFARVHERRLTQRFGEEIEKEHAERERDIETKRRVEAAEAEATKPASKSLTPTKAEGIYASPDKVPSGPTGGMRSAPADVLRAAGFEVVSSGKVPAGWMFIVRDVP